MAQRTPPLVVGIDGSAPSLRAAQWAAAVADRCGTSLRLVHSTVTVGHSFTDAAVVAIHAAAVAAQQDTAHRVLDAAKTFVTEHYPRLIVDVVTVDAPAGDALVRMSGEAALVVLGCDDVTPAAALLIGSTTLRIAGAAACPVVAWREVARPGTEPVVVGVDGTPAGTAALAAAFEFADRYGAPITAVHSWWTGMDGDEVTVPHLIDWDALREAEWSLLTDAVEPWQQKYPHVQVSILLDDAKPGRALLARLAGAQLVVVGNHRGSVLSAALLGSTSLNLLHHARVPVMICRAGSA
ncbi:universal stress protein [Mycobacterium sp. GA-2829]|uniref:universal stress protein n=1 Tax=Mycobacterium sp. GA-2829 TaxID=1772283 RepID=UPI00073FB000|nr:universal stress protein [Mycobacterium sp. GA-2829]KUI32598.1 universal stress protein [Mycobacterium sp. GA-2829]